jgi:hypothetical protein
LGSKARIQHRRNWRRYYYRNRDKVLVRSRAYHSRHDHGPKFLAGRRDNYRTNPKAKFYAYRHNAKKRSLAFRISFKQFMSFWQKPCHYCGGKIETIGLDRINNSLGYSIKNIVSCCTTCNRAKLKQTRDEYIAHCRRVARHNP